ncbi:MAG: hypothetical protein CFE38_20975, partial [Comamonadaceae bacterium PBBC1]
TGTWLYNLDNSKPTTQALAAGQQVSDQLTVSSKDGTASQLITVTVTGAADANATAISGTSTGTAIEDSTAQASGTLSVTGSANSADNVLQAPTSLAGQYGNFTLNTTTGAWTYTLDNSKAATQALTQGQSVTDKLTVTSKDGKAIKEILVTVSGVNDAAVISGQATGSVTEDSAAQTTASGTLAVTDVDTGQAFLSTPTTASLAGTYGNFTLNTATGTWTYTLDNSKPATQALAQGQQVTDTLRVTSQDGSATQDIVVTVNGVNETVAKPTTISEVTDNAGNPGGATQTVPNGASTNDTTPSFKGTGTPGEVVTLKDGDKVIGSTTVNPDGTWNFTAPEQATGPHSYTASTPSGGTTAPFTVTVDTAPPTIALSVDKANIGSADTASVTFTLSEASADFIKDDITVTGGSLGPLVQSATNPLVYTATFTPTPGTTAGSSGIVRVDSNKFTDAAGNANADGLEANNSVSITVVAGKPTAISEVTDNVGNPGGATQSVPNGASTNDTTPSFKGTGTPGEVVTLKDGDKIIGSTTVNPDGTWSFTAPEQATGPHSYTASTPSGGTTAPFTVTVDTAPPTIAVTIDKTSIGSDEMAQLTFTLSEASSDFSNSDITVTGGKLGTLVQSSTNPLVYTAVFTPDGSAAAGTVRV